MAHETEQTDTRNPLPGVIWRVTICATLCAAVSILVAATGGRIAAAVGVAAAWAMSVTSLIFVFYLSGSDPQKLGVSQFASIAFRMIAGVPLMLLVKRQVPDNAAAALLAFAGANFVLLSVESFQVVKQIRLGYTRLKEAAA